MIYPGPATFADSAVGVPGGPRVVTVTSLLQSEALTLLVAPEDWQG